jgi:hypothetical protein
VKPPYDEPDHKGEIDGLDLNSYLRDIKGDDETTIQFDTVPGFLFVEHPSGIGWDDLKIEIDGVNPYTGSTYSVKDLYTKAEGQKEDIEWLKNRTEATIQYEFAGIFNEEKIKYAVTPPTSLKIWSDNIGDNNVHNITANLVIVLPMTFNFSGNAELYPAASGSTGGKFLRVKFADLDKFLEGDSDTGSDGLMQQIEDQLEENGGKITKLELKLSNIKNTVIEGLCLAIASDSEPDDKQPNKKWHIIDLENGGNKNIPVNTESLVNLPQIRFLLREKTPDSNTGTLTVRPLSSLGNQAAFNVNISVVASIKLDKTIDL